MKPFNIEKALAGDPVITRDGTKVLSIAYCKGALNPVIALILGNEYVTTHDPDGEYLNRGKEHKFDLFMAPKIRKVKVFLIRHLGNIIAATEYQVECCGTPIVDQNDLLKTIEVEVEE